MTGMAATFAPLPTQAGHTLSIQSAFDSLPIALPAGRTSALSKPKADQMSGEEEQEARPNDRQDTSPDHETERKPAFPSAGRTVG
jgi:hypothetical protein